MASDNNSQGKSSVGKSCLVVFSGGQDSTTCLHWALSKFKGVQAIFFRYGQRHAIEEKSAEIIADRLGISLFHCDLEFIASLGVNALTHHGMKICEGQNGLPNTFVPGRNLFFLTCAAARAYLLGIRDIVTGVCQTDYSGYPDCRSDTMVALQKAVSLGLDAEYTIHTPLMHLTKAETVKLAKDLGGLESLAFSHTCYEGKFPPCGSCPACVLRAKGFRSAGIKDPLLTRASGKYSD